MLKKGTGVAAPTTIVTLQYLVGMVLVGGWIAATGGLAGALDSIGRRWQILFAAVLLQIAGYIMFVVGLRHAGSNSLPTAAVVAIAAVNPAFVALLSAPVLGEHLSWNHAVAIALILAGILFTQLG
jgi:drug/metabolite transporter (DMT)-like permease